MYVFCHPWNQGVPISISLVCINDRKAETKLSKGKKVTDKRAKKKERIEWEKHDENSKLNTAYN